MPERRFERLSRSRKTVRKATTIPIMNHHSPEGHCEIDFDVSVPAENMLGKEGDGFTVAQARLGPGRIHHCVRTIRQCEFALELMVARAKSRVAFGSTLADYANIQDWIAESRIENDQARVLVLRTAWLMDKSPPKPPESTSRRSRSWPRAFRHACSIAPSRSSAPRDLPTIRPLPTSGHGAARCASSTARTKFISVARAELKKARTPNPSLKA
jgi:acyl-CoA dehydrogenase